MTPSPDPLQKDNAEKSDGAPARSALAAFQTAIEAARDAWAAHEAGQNNQAVLGEMGALESGAGKAEEAALAPFREAMEKAPDAAWDLLDAARIGSFLRGWGVWAAELVAWISRLPALPENPPAQEPLEGAGAAPGMTRKAALRRLLSTEQPFWGHAPEQEWIPVQGPPKSLADMRSLRSVGYPFLAAPPPSPIWSGSMWWSSPQKNALATVAATAWRQEALCEESGRVEEQALWAAVGAQSAPESPMERPLGNLLPDDARHGLLLGVEWNKRGEWASGATLERALRDIPLWTWLGFWGEAQEALPRLFPVLLARAQENTEFGYALASLAWRQGNKAALLEMARKDEALVDAIAGGASFTAPMGWGNADLSDLAGRPVMDGRETIGPVMSSPWMRPFFEPFLQDHFRGHAQGVKHMHQATAAKGANTPNAVIADDAGDEPENERISLKALMFSANAYGGEVHACLKACLGWLKSVAQRDALEAEAAASMSARDWASKTNVDNPNVELGQSGGDDGRQSHLGARRL